MSFLEQPKRSARNRDAVDCTRLSSPLPFLLTSCTTPARSSRPQPLLHRSSIAGLCALPPDACAVCPLPPGSSTRAALARLTADGLLRWQDCYPSRCVCSSQKYHHSVAGDPGSPSEGSSEVAGITNTTIIIKDTCGISLRFVIYKFSIG